MMNKIGQIIFILSILLVACAIFFGAYIQLVDTLGDHYWHERSKLADDRSLKKIYTPEEIDKMIPWSEPYKLSTFTKIVNVVTSILGFAFSGGFLFAAGFLTKEMFWEKPDD